jgi:hypothetical protein
MTIDEFITYWQRNQGGAERANYTVFINQLCEVLDLPKPGAGAGGTLGDYQFEGPVSAGSLKGGTGFIDLYYRNHFILEAKQSKLPAATQPSLYDPVDAAPVTPAGAKYDQLMRDARRQAEHYAHSLPGSHSPVPFLIVCDVGRSRAFELYFDYAGNGRGYGFFPDKQRYRIALADLASETKLPGVDLTPADLLRAIWLKPASIDPRVRSADVTRDVARKLAQVSIHLEEEGRQELRRRGEADAAHEAALVEGTALFLMRILFCMFAEDVGLLPEDSFTNFLKSCKRPYNPDRPGDLVNNDKLRRELIQLWGRMNSPDPDDRFAFALDESVRYFNGGLFERQDYYPIGFNDLDSLIDAARHRWTNVEPAIFGTLLEQALSAKDRAKLGAHYTPRPYVERLVQATITDVLAPEWTAVEDAIQAVRAAGDHDSALAKATEFLTYLQAQRVLDPACGTGNFLYVAMETLLRLESDVIETIATLGGSAVPRIGPENFLGLELNPRAAVIAELVLWIGWLRWRTANDPAAVPDPVLRRTSAINFGGQHGYDAVLARDEAGEIAQPPRQPEWPEAEFIVGNPPFIGKGKDMREALGHSYVDSLPSVYRHVPKSADFVMYWWDRAAVELSHSTRRFGLISTNSIKQVFNRRVVENHMQSTNNPVSLAWAVYDHPWRAGTKDAAVVRTSMTVGQSGHHTGVLLNVISETALGSDSPRIELGSERGIIHSDLTVGANAGGTIPLEANLGVSWNGVMLSGRGFLPSPADVIAINAHGEAPILRLFLSGKDMTGHDRKRYIIDPAALSEQDIRRKYPVAYDILLRSVFPERAKKRDTAFRDRWWAFGRNRSDLREAISDLERYIAVPETSVYRLFQFVGSSILPEHRLVCIASGDAFLIGVLLSNIHIEWSFRTGGTLEDRPTYTKSRCFDPFPFPDPTPDQRTAIADLGEELDATRKAALAEHPRLTMTGLYNLVEKLRAGATLTPAEEVDARDGRARIVRKLHDDLDVAVAAAYGWPADLAPAEIAARLVALNAERAAEEQAGHIRWLRPDYQIPRFAKAPDAPKPRAKRAATAQPKDDT